MGLHLDMSEVDFIEAIDASFCFDCEEDYLYAVEVACQISDNAVLMIGYELVSESSYTSLEVNIKLLRMMQRLRPSAVILASVPVIEAHLLNKPVSQQQLQTLLGTCANHTNAWNGLAIVECIDKSLHSQCDIIRNRWRSEANERNSQ